MARILIADDDADFRCGLAETLSDAGHTLIEAENGSQALRAFERERLDAALIDLRMPGLSGLDLLGAVHEQQLAPGVPIVVLTGFADAPSTIDAMRLGAFDHLTKPVGRDALIATISQALAVSMTGEHAPSSPGEASEAPETSTRADQLVGNSPPMREVHKRIGLAARSQAPVLITGETGTGKEVVARLLHRHGPRAKGPFVAVNCAAIPAELIESELFGHVKGAFSGAIADRAGSFQQAEGGVLFLDEIGDMPLSMQAKLLRVLQDHEFKPIGSARSRRADVRVVAATHHDLAAAVLEGRFRADLRFRLDVLRLHLPALRDRLADVLPLAQHFLRLAGSGKQLSREAAQRLMGYEWPGNVRELRNVIERAAAISRTDVLGPDDIDMGGHGRAAAAATASGPPASWDGLTLPEAVAKLERELIADALRRSGGNRAEAARLLGIRRQLLYAKLVTLGLDML